MKWLNDNFETVIGLLLVLSSWLLPYYLGWEWVGW